MPPPPAGCPFGRVKTIEGAIDEMIASAGANETSPVAPSGVVSRKVTRCPSLRSGVTLYPPRLRAVVVDGASVAVVVLVVVGVVAVDGVVVVETPPAIVEVGVAPSSEPEHAA